MQLTELHPKWVGVHNWCGNPHFRCGIVFDCPHCLKQRIAIFFTPPIDPDHEWDKFDRAELYPDHPKWTRQGETFDTITLTPSIDVSQYEHWHGFIENGQIK